LKTQRVRAACEIGFRTGEYAYLGVLSVWGNNHSAPRRSDNADGAAATLEGRKPDLLVQVANCQNGETHNARRTSWSL
jgi:hypothetical protein